jgi:hypothetical protein
MLAIAYLCGSQVRRHNELLPTGPCTFRPQRVVEYHNHRRTRFLYAVNGAPNSLSSTRSSGTI